MNRPSRQNRLEAGLKPVTVRLFPNGECVVFRNKIKKSAPKKRYKKTEPDTMLWRYWQLSQHTKSATDLCLLFMGLSLVRNFDSPSKFCLSLLSSLNIEAFALCDGFASPSPEDVQPAVVPPKRYGLKGITRSGARTVRNAAHLIQKRYGLGKLSFATVTVPQLEGDDMRVLHENWGQVVEIYRLNIKRILERKGLPTHLLTVSEVQEKRHKKTGQAVLHLHSLWVGRLPYGGWAISTKMHDVIWRRALRTVINIKKISLSSACNVQEVRSSASGYMGKYMSKGVKCVAALVKDGFGGWLPKQWWNCTRDLSRWVKEETVTTANGAEMLMEAARDVDSKAVWKFVGHVTIDIGTKQDYWLATYGRLAPDVADFIRSVAGLTGVDDRATLPEDITKSRGAQMLACDSGYASKDWAGYPSCDLW